MALDANLGPISQASSCVHRTAFESEEETMGLQTADEIPYGKTFGPITIEHESRDPRHVIGHMTRDEFTEAPMTKISLSVLEDPARLSDWLTHVHPARNETEQNMEIYSKEGGLYYRALRTILAEEEILAWYSRDLAVVLGIPDVLPLHVKEDGSLHCSMCQESFKHPFTFRAHLAFICQHRLSHQSGPLDMSTPRSRDFPSTTPRSRDFPSTTPRSRDYPSTTPRSRDYPPVPPQNGTTTNRPYEHSQDATQPRGVTSKHVMTTSKHVVAMTTSKHVVDDELERVAKKRRISGDSSGDESTDRNQNIRHKSHNRRSPPRVVIEQCSPSSSHLTSPDLSPVSFHGIDSLDPRSLDPRLNDPRNIESRIPDPRSLDPRVPDPRSLDPRVPDPRSLDPRVQDPRSLDPRITDPRSLDPRLPDPRNLDPRSMDPRFNPMMKSPMMPYLSYPPRPMMELRVPDLNQEIRQLEASVVHSRMLTDRMYMPYQTLKSQNPVVEKLLTTPLPPTPLIPASMVQMNLLQNWCAKCNATFRMTSDLVYHMRSHHKRDTDPVKRQRDEKLKCSICHETFKERHHLTRHMTSHL